MTAFEFRCLDAALGAEINGVDLSKRLDGETLAQIRRALLDSNGLLIFRGQKITPDLAFWDNRCTLHLALGCPPELRRHMPRTTIKGDRPYE